MEKRRARSLKELHEKHMAMFGVFDKDAEKYRPRETDVIISPFGKCGTTWLQQIFHTLRTAGDTDYDDISAVVPWIEMAPLLKMDINAEQRANPRGFKSHMTWDEAPRGCKYIVSLRDPRDALVSMYKFMEGWFIEPDAIPINEFARGNYMHPERRGYWRHLLSWWEHRDDSTVLLLTYEWMLENPAETIRKVAAFCDIALTDDLLELTLQNSSIEFMLKHKDKFDDLGMRVLSESVAGLPPGSDSAKVREGKAGSHKTTLSEELVAELDEIWKADVTSVTGFETYAAIEAAVRARL